MTEEVDKSIEERPATYKKTGQFWMIAVGAVLALILIFDIVRRMVGAEGPDNQAATKEASRPPVVREDVVAIETYEQRLEQARRRREAERLQDPSGETPKDAIARLQEQKEIRLRQQAQLQDEQSLFDLKSTQKSPEEVFEEEERLRVLRSRRSGFNLALEEASPTASSVPKADGGFIQGLHQASRSGTDAAGTLTRQNELLARELERMEQLRANLGAPGTPAVQVSDVLRARGGMPAAMQETSSPAETLEVGKPVVEAQKEGGPRPGQKLLSTGTVISAVLDQDLMSDYAGSYRAVVVRDVYDVSGNYILIPKGAKIIGKSMRIQNVNEPIQARMGLPATWAVLPDGKRISFEKTGALDQAGIGALKDKVNRHLLAQFLGVAAYAVLSVESSRSGSGYENDNTFAGDLGESMREQFAPLAAKYLNLVPTITLRSGLPMKIFIEDDLYVTPWRKTFAQLVPKY